MTTNTRLPVNFSDQLSDKFNFESDESPIIEETIMKDIEMLERAKKLTESLAT